MNPCYRHSCSLIVHRLSNLFNAIPRRSALRLSVHKTLLELASTNDELDLLGITQSEVDKWLTEWDISPEEKSAYLKLLVDVYQKAAELSVLHL